MNISRSLYRIFWKLIILLTLLLILFNEYLVYRLHRLAWNSIECDTNNCTRILLVADPQLIGEDFDTNIYNPIAINDADRYLRNTFIEALAHSQPNIICFLGDLLDEGSVASTRKFNHYSQRFNNIFRADNSITRIHIPGDNDIGGENGEYISEDNLRRFAIQFSHNDNILYKQRMIFYKINALQLTFDRPDVPGTDNMIRVGVSHLPILTSGGSLLRDFLKYADPHVIFSAHWHKSKSFIYPGTSPRSLETSQIFTYDLLKIKSMHEYLEINVPTCSYRMGTFSIGYGLAVIDGGVMQYTVLWTISRFTLLELYLGWILIIFLFCFVLQLSAKYSWKFRRQRLNGISLMKTHF